MATQYEAAIEAFKKNPHSPYLVSFPRTGAHWLRAVLELYFRRPTIPRHHTFPSREDYFLFHTHDHFLEARPKSAIYLLRDPVDTVYSFLIYERFRKGGVGGRAFIWQWTWKYALHLRHWLVEEKFTVRKTVIHYEALEQDAVNEFGKAIRHLSDDYDRGCLEACIAWATKEVVRRRTSRRIVPDGSKYAAQREEFRDEWAEVVWSAIKYVSRFYYNDETRLLNLFSAPAKEGAS